MKQVIKIILVAALVFILFMQLMWHIIGGNIYSIVGSIEDAVLDSNGDIVIDTENINEQPSYIVYKYKGISMGLIAIRNSKGKVIVVVNSCNTCEVSPNSYYLYKDKKFVCSLCENKIAIDDLDNGEDCYPIKVEERKDEDGKIIIGTKQLKELKDKFINWRGPTV